MRYVIFAALLFFSLAGKTQSGDTSSITAHFSNLKIDQFADELQKKTGYFFYYDARQLDSITFNFSVTNQPLSKVLETAFASTDFYFSIAGNNRVFITSGQPIFTSIGMSRTRVPRRTATARIDEDSASRSAFAGVAGVKTLESVTISAALNVRSTTMGVQSIDIKTIKQVPVLFGEADVLRVVLATPGVKTVGEASTGLNVRGGSTDQNLILFNDATIYNPAHFFGMFSAFNPDLVKEVNLYKSSVPARYGGRLSSVLDIEGRQGDKTKYTGVAGIGLLTGKIMLEGPIVKDKTSFLFGARSTYADWLLKLLPEEYENSTAGFYDVNLNLSHTINKSNEISATGYFSKDRFTLNGDTTFGYENKSVSLKWKHSFNKVTSTFTGGYDDYLYNTSSHSNPVNAYKLSFNVNQKYLRAHFNYYLDNRHTVDFGFNSVYYTIKPGTLKPYSGSSLVETDIISAEQALESAIYLNDKFDISNDLSIEGGVRYSLFNYLGPKDINTYVPGLPKTEDNMTGSESFDSWKFIKTYGGPEYRVSARYIFGDQYSVKASFNTQRQYIHMLSNTTSMAPTDTWKLSDPNVKPQQGSQVSLGLYKNLVKSTVEISFEVYYKKIRDYLDYKSGARLIMNHQVETDVINTKGRAYGAEFMIKKLSGKLNGWLSYTYSRIELKQDDPNAGELINKGEFYPANYDKPHDVTFIGNYRINKRLSFSFNATYSTGRPITLPTGRYFYSGGYRTLYGPRNGHRIPDYFRTDFSVNIDGNHKVKQVLHNSWTIGIYNITGRKNPYSVYYISEGGAINGYKLSVFGSAIPFVTYNVRF
ncbi:MAG: TonB-dependent receptor plug domain-containing protein [Chitinophagaceae bacterium]|nr:TonB-dependent receptor plug domain-containing protein [Chitinophagaceae bacterium]